MVIKPIFDPVADVLKEAGVIKPGVDKNNLRELMDANGIGLESVVEQISSLAMDSMDPAIRLRASEAALKMHNVMDANKAATPMISITILPLTKEVNEEIPPILLPRAEQTAL